MKTKHLVCTMAIVTVLLLGMGTGHAATISILGPTEITTPQFSFDIVIDDILPLANLDEWNLGLMLVPLGGASGATFVSAFTDVNVDTNYVFYGDSFDFGYTIVDPLTMVVGDLTASAVGKTDVVDKLLTTITVDVSMANVCDWFSIALFDTNWSYFGDDAGVYEGVQLAEVYDFHVVPIPGTMLLLGSGLVALIGLRRRIKRA